MLSKKMRDALNGQVNAEIYSWYLYLSMSAWFKGENFEGFANWMAKQADEELNHARKIYDFIYSRQGTVELLSIDKPKSKWSNPMEVMEDTLKHEKKVTAMINKLVEVAREENDNAAEFFLQWFVTEQVEEEDTVTGIIARMKLAGDHPAMMFQLDEIMGTRQ